MASMDPKVAELEKDVDRVEPAGQEAAEKGSSRWADPKFRRGAVGVAAVLVLVVAGLFVHYHNRISTDDAEVDGHIVPIASKIYGNVSDVLVVDNQQVKAGQVLVRIDPRDNQARLDLAKAALELAEGPGPCGGRGCSAYPGNHAKHSPLGADAQLKAAQANSDRRDSPSRRTPLRNWPWRAPTWRPGKQPGSRPGDLARMKPLVAKSEISQQQYDAYLAAARVAESELDAANEKLVSAGKGAEISRASMLAAKAQVDQARAMLQQAVANHKQVSIREADQASAEATVAKARADLESAQLQFSYTTIVAPTDGVVTRKSVEVGQIVQPGQGLFALIPLHDIWVTANFKETQLAKVHPARRPRSTSICMARRLPAPWTPLLARRCARLSLLPPENATGNYVKIVQRIPVKILLDPVSADRAILRLA